MQIDKEIPKEKPKKVRVMVIEDETDIRVVIKGLLEAQGFEVTDLASGHAVLYQIERFEPDVLLVDQMMPGITGMEVIAEVRKDPRSACLPIIMLTGLTGEEEKVNAFSKGADDYVTKPFMPKELAARIHALLRRSTPIETENGVAVQELVHGDIRIELRSHRAYVSNEQLQLTLTEFKILRELLRKPDQVLTREQLRERALESVNVTDRTIDVHMASLRKKMGPVGDIIETVRGVGYRLAR